MAFRVMIGIVGGWLHRHRNKEFIAKIGLVIEEADETVFWLELLLETGIFSSQKLGNLLQETNELLAIFAASHHTAQGRDRANGSMTQSQND